MAWNNLEQNDDTFITCWKQFLSCQQSKQLVPNWETKMQDVNSYLVQVDNSETPESDEQKEEWMLMAELNFDVEDEHAQSIFPTDEYWSDQRKNYSAKQIGEMPSWISEMKKTANSDWRTSVRLIDVTTLNELQYLAYKIVKDHFTISNENLNGKPLFVLVRGIAGSGKSYAIDALRNLLQSKCQVLAYTGKAAYNVNGVTLHSLFKFPIGSDDNMA